MKAMQITLPIIERNASTKHIFVKFYTLAVKSRGKKGIVCMSHYDLPVVIQR